MELTGKVILLISSEPWGKIYISKHHYANALAARGNKVFFLNPPDFTLKRGTVNIREINEHLSVISYRPVFPWVIKFHARWLFDLLIRKIIANIIKHTGSIDIVWDFNCSYLYNDLSAFGASMILFHPVDKISADTANKKADIVFSVSQLILNDYKVPDVPRYLVNHGISSEFIKIAKQPALSNSGSPVKACYIGNLLIPSLDREMIKGLVSKHPEVEFVFIGPYNNKNNIAGSSLPGDEEFIDFLRTNSNVTLTGVLDSAEIAALIPAFDVFLVCYKTSEHYRCDNTHKVLEYLSTGKVIVSTPILYYKDSDLFEISDRDDVIETFTRVTAALYQYNSDELMRRRKDFALNNTYEKHIGEIEAHCSRHIK